MKANREIEMFVKGICAVYGMNEKKAEAKTQMDSRADFLRNLELIYGMHIVA